jgi:hypothetical protein
MKHLVTERCKICNCKLNRSKEYAQQTQKGRSGATKHHFVAERLFGRSSNRRGTTRPAIFSTCPWNCEGRRLVLCYECHEELVHNPVLLPEDFDMLNALVCAHGLHEEEKPENREKIAGRVKLFHDAISLGLRQMVADSKRDEANLI